MAFNVSTFRSKMAFDGARPNLFKVLMTAPAINTRANPGADLEYFVRATSIPGSTIGTVTVPYMGREIKLAGNRTFADWTVTVINDENFSYRGLFEEWMDSINLHEGNYRQGTGNSTDYTDPTGTVVQQLAKTGDFSSPQVVRQYKFYNLFPIDISEITLDWGDNDSVEEFTVTFAYDYWKTEAPNPKTGGTGPEGLRATG
jgi:hypothetical protein